MGSIEILDLQPGADPTDRVGDERITESVERVIWFAFRMRVVMIFLAAHHFLFFHLDACEVLDQPFDVSLILPGNHELRIHGSAWVLPLDDLDGSFNPE